MSLKTTLFLLLAASLGFLCGKIDFAPPPAPIVVEKKIEPQQVLIKINQISGDLLQAEIIGKARIIWSGENFLEKSGDIPLGQIPNENDRKLAQFPYTGNAKTMKFYPSDSYFARGVEVKYRRFFETKEGAVKAGFLASKGVK
jgi:hypothetical protein